MQRGPQYQPNTANANVATGELGTVRVVVQGTEWSFGPNEKRTFADDGIGIAVAAADARLRVVDSRDSAMGTLRT